MTDPADTQAAQGPTVVQFFAFDDGGVSGGDVVIDDGGGDILTLEGVRTTSLTAGDFRFG